MSEEKLAESASTGLLTSDKKAEELVPKGYGPAFEVTDLPEPPSNLNFKNYSQYLDPQ